MHVVHLTIILNLKKKKLFPRVVVSIEHKFEQGSSMAMKHGHSKEIGASIADIDRTSTPI